MATVNAKPKQDSNTPADLPADNNQDRDDRDDRDDQDETETTGTTNSNNDSNINNNDNNESAINNNNSSNSKNSYKQKYKRTWELEHELKDWLTACSSDAYAAFCKYCRTKLHAHKKGLLAHAKSAKHKKHAENIHNISMGDLSIVPFESFTNGNDRDLSNGADLSDNFDGKGIKRNHKGQRLFNDNWLKDPIFSTWLRKLPSNNTKALCIACRCVLSAGKCELIKHTRAAKHKKAITDGPLQELRDSDLQWLETTANQQQEIFSSGRYSINIPSMPSNQVSSFRPSVIDLPGMLVDEIIKRLEKFIPLELAGSWDNVGVITQPIQPIRVYNMMLTIDLNEKIAEEAIQKRVQFIISYHPPIFTPVQNLKANSWKNRAILMCIENKIAVYSPHTALDAIKGGINDWLISAFSSGDDGSTTTRPIQYSIDKTNTSCLEVLLSETQESATQIFKDVNNVTLTGYGETSTDVRVTCDDKTLPGILEHLVQSNCSQLSSRVTRLVGTPIPGVGMGRIVTRTVPLPLYEVVHRTKTYLDLTHVRLALSPQHTRDTKISSIAVCAGSGSSVLKGCKADIWITGEMSHHEVLDAINNGITVILCEHSNTERGFLRDWSQQLKTNVFDDQVLVSVSELDRDPLRII